MQHREKKVGVADFGVFIGASFGIPIDLHMVIFRGENLTRRADILEKCEIFVGGALARARSAQWPS